MTGAGNCDNVSLSPLPAHICVCSPLWATNKVCINRLLLCCFLSLSSDYVEKIHEDSGTKDCGGEGLPRVRQMGLCGAYVLFGASRILTVEPWYRLLGLS